MFEWSIPPTVVALALILPLVYWLRRDRQLHEIPTVGFSTPLLSYITAFRFISHAHSWVEEGYRKHKPGLFKIAMLDHWHVFVTSRQLIEDITKAPDHILSTHDAARYFLQADHTFGPDVFVQPYHISVCQMQLTRALSAVFCGMYEELTAAFEEAIPVKEDVWMPVPIGDVLRDVICRVSNRVFVGAPLCRDKEYQQLNIAYSMSVVQRAWVVNQFPKLLRPIAGHLLTELPKHTRHAGKHLKPLIEERRRNLKEHGKEWEGKPNDLLMWLMDSAGDEDVPVANILRRMLVLNFAAIHTTSMSLTHALYHIADSPEYVQPLRDEVEAVVASDGWTKASMGKLRKVGSFLRESQRVHGIDAIAMKRLSHQPFTFSNGVTIPAGVIVSCPIRATHSDDANYPHADVFDGFRFSKLRESDGTKYQLASTTPDYLAFAHGKHACPGRFFAANELKAMLAHILVTYDVKFPEGCSFPPDRFFGTACTPGSADLMFRKRQV
ncbi:cytochrome P450 [Artomyces pyxidatus]|uniref:Cytochrome P450 n=1 Tax=Artomyces pyxidatus TaxID=48021 RepID=A0ACB8SW28_9AGAM|nr:cytochrome P450 [Artomyces pyxidatus]